MNHEQITEFADFQPTEHGRSGLKCITSERRRRTRGERVTVNRYHFIFYPRKTFSKYVITYYNIL